MLSFYRPEFCLFRLQICTSWSSPISATTSTFVLVCPFGADFQTSTFACYNICPFGLQLLQHSLLLSTLNTHASMFPFCSTFGTLNICFGFLSLSTFCFFPFDFASLSGFSSFWLIWLCISFVHWFVLLISCSFVLIQFNSRRRDPCSKDFREVTVWCKPGWDKNLWNVTFHEFLRCPIL